MYGHTCDGVGVEVPGLFRHVEDARDEGLRPGRQLTEKQKKTRTFALRPGKEPERLEKRFQPETKGSREPFIARLPVGYTRRSIHLHDLLSNYSCSSESLP